MEYSAPKWIVHGPKDLEKTLKRMPKEVGRLYSVFVGDLENEGPFPKDWRIIHLHGNLKGLLRAVLKRDYRVIYRYDSRIITIVIEKLADRKDAYEV